MPTSRPRHTLTETDDLSRALDDAGARWPDEKEARTRLLLRLVEAGHRAIQGENDSRAAQRRDVIRRTAGTFDDVYAADHLERLREDWPA